MSSTGQTPDSDELARAAEQIEAPLASLVGDYEERDTHNSPRAKGIFLLPNLFTSGAGFTRLLRVCRAIFMPGLWPSWWP